MGPSVTTNDNTRDELSERVAHAAVRMCGLDRYRITIIRTFEKRRALRPAFFLGFVASFTTYGAVLESALLTGPAVVEPLTFPAKLNTGVTSAPPLPPGPSHQCVGPKV